MKSTHEIQAEGNDFGKIDAENTPLLGREPPTPKSDIGKILIFSFALMTISVAQNIEFSILGSFVSKGLGTDSYAAFTASNSILSFVIYMYIIATYGITSRLADEVGANNLAQV